MAEAHGLPFLEQVFGDKLVTPGLGLGLRSKPCNGLIQVSLSSHVGFPGLFLSFLLSLKSSLSAHSQITQSKQNEARMVNSNLTQRFQHIHLLGVIPDGVGVDEPAVVLVSHLAVTQREVLVIWLRKLVLILHLYHFIVAAVLTAFSFKREALNTVSVKRFRVLTTILCQK